jgi:succinate dehydrogenase / fumarate reductase iron-sulfur subunit
MVVQMTDEAFGYCTNTGECEAVCPKGIKIENIARMNRDYLKAALTYRQESQGGGAG